MQDRFKFRVWYTPWDETEQPEMLYNAESAYDYMGEVPSSSFGSVLEDKSFEVMQCTGLKDKNGKLIYEGDIIKCWREDKEIGKFLVLYKKSGYRFACNFPDDNGYYIAPLADSLSFWEDDRLEIIGNIYENPELLESN